MQPQAVTVTNPFTTPAPASGFHADWQVREIDTGAVVSEEMDHGMAMRILVDHRDFMVCRADRPEGPLPHALCFDSSWMTAPSTLDISPALEVMEPGEFVALLNDDFREGEAARQILGLLQEQGDPRVERLMMYETDWATPDEEGLRAKACLRVDQESLMAWCEKNRPDIHDELSARLAPETPSYID